MDLLLNVFIYIALVYVCFSCINVW